LIIFDILKSMKLDLKKIDDFYSRDLGQYASPHIVSLLKNIMPPIDKNATCVCSAGIFPFADFIDGTKRTILQSSHDMIKPDNAKSEFFVAIDPTKWPYRAEDVDHIILIHDLEFMNDPDVYLREAWRVLKGEGQLTIIFPNRAGRWAGRDNNPFGWGYPYTPAQMQKLLGKAHFTVDGSAGALYFPPYKPKTKLASMAFKMLEKIGQYCLLNPGIIGFTASKHIYAPTKGMKVMDVAAEKAKQALFPKPVVTPKNHKEKPLNNSYKRLNLLKRQIIRLTSYREFLRDQNRQNRFLPRCPILF
jgi:SAM-dependent methyltransferase